MSTPCPTPRQLTAPHLALEQRRLYIISNSGSGHQDSDRSRDIMASVLTDAGRQFEFITIGNPARLPAAARDTAAQARQDGGIVVVAGGDGTLNTVCQALAGTGIPLGVIPQGTFNYFARTHRIPEDTEAATRCLLDAKLEAVHAGFLNDRLFLVNASLGLYPRLLEDREAYKNQLGRSRIVALISALATLSRAHRVLSVEAEVAGQSRVLRTVSLVVGNNALQLEHIGVELGDALRRGQLAAMVIRPIGTLALYGLLLRGMARRLGSAEHLESFPFTGMRITRGRQRSIKVALDGEVSRMRLPLRFRAAPQALPLLVPRDKASAETR
ncbi:diacylglycerol/lipid kinase family protein [Parahaliea aestuarii]|uniref:Diacylglycerol kinase n=1 Tax=Parahaliea aestuarii TaxID=1852021 RepID=A0A5C8ZRG9_9GAMM|nr:diacylglycerol kinase family protein [Parahaliea aestuarii]TXS90097.1 diacylglycerol kinase [Parahaliea aestuarii]